MADEPLSMPASRRDVLSGALATATLIAAAPVAVDIVEDRLAPLLIRWRNTHAWVNQRGLAEEETDARSDQLMALQQSMLNIVPGTPRTAVDGLELAAKLVADMWGVDPHGPFDEGDLYNSDILLALSLIRGAQERLSGS